MTEPANRDAVPHQRRGGRWQFGLGPLLGTLMILCIPFALWGAVLRANEADQHWLMLLCAMVPLGVMLLVAAAVYVGSWLRSRRRSRALLDDDRWT